MPLTDQEQQCIDFARDYLEKHYGGTWAITEFLDDQNHSEPTPEVILSNGDKTAAIEVKRLTGDSTWQEYLAALLSNDDYFVPSCGGHYYLSPPVDFRLPMQRPLRRLVQEEIERVAPTLGPGQNGAIRIPRDGRVSLISKSGPPFIYCLHLGPYSGLLAPLKEKITGSFMLIDEGLEHSFVTQKCISEFENAVLTACKNRLEGDNTPFNWDEEWELIRVEDEGDDERDGVWIIATTDARSMSESVEECVHTVLHKAMQKFRTRRWADLQVIVLESSIMAPAGLAAQAVETFDPDDRTLVDHFLIADGDDVTEAKALVSEQSRTAEVDEERRLQHIIDSPISHARVKRFEEEYLKCRWDIGATEKIFKHSEAFTHRSERNDSASFGVSRLVPKGPFVDDSSWADLRGWEFASAHERRLLTNLGAHFAESVNQTGQRLPDEVARRPDEILNAAKTMSDRLADGGFIGNLIVVAAPLDTDTMVALNEIITTPGWELGDELRTNWILGVHADCPVLYLGDTELNCVFVVDVQNFASLVQFDPQVDLHVLPIDEATATHIVEGRPDLALDVLRTMVQFTLYQSYSIEVADPKAIWGAKLSP